jgi:hypothetical protein
MMTTAGTAVTNLLERIRDVGGISLSGTYPPSLAAGKIYAKTLLSVAQRYINAAEENSLVEISFTTTPYQTLYEIDADPVLGTGGSSPIIKIVSIQDDASTKGKDIGEAPFQQIYTTDFGWFRRVGPRFLAWARVGRDCWVLYPAQSSAVQIGITAVPYIVDLVNDSDLFTVTDDVIPQVMDLAEAMALFKMGEYKAAAIPLGRLQESYKAELLGDQWRKQMSSQQ